MRSYRVRRDDPPKTLQLRSRQEVAAHARAFECSEAELRIAMRQVGPTAQKVREYIRAIHGGAPRSPLVDS